MLKKYLFLACITFSIALSQNAIAQEKTNTQLRIEELQKDSAKVAQGLVELKANKLEEEQHLLGLNKHFLNKTVKESENKAQWAVLLDLDKQIIEQTLEYEKIEDEKIIYKIVDITGKKIAIETLLQGEKNNYIEYIEIIKAWTSHNAIKLKIYREEELLITIGKMLENLRKKP